MIWRWVRVQVATISLAATPLSAQTVTELGIQAIGTASEPAMAVGAGYAAIRVSRRFRLSASAGLGGSGGQTAWRGEALAHFMLSPRSSGLGFYMTGGVAAVGGQVEEGYLVLSLGLESSPGRASGWFVEAGVGGGARLAAGYRWRRFPPWWPLGP
jgi:hypothetical protein